MHRADKIPNGVDQPDARTHYPRCLFLVSLSIQRHDGRVDPSTPAIMHVPGISGKTTQSISGACTDLGKYVKKREVFKTRNGYPSFGG